MKKALVTGITGQDGAYLSQLLLNEGYQVLGIVRNINNFQSEKLRYLEILNEIQFEETNLTDLVSVMRLLSEYQPDEIYNLAAQSSVGLSFKEPISTIQVNSQSVLTFLEAIRLVNKDIKFYQASSSEMFGQVNQLPITENSIMHPVSPYAISKATAYWSTICYRESYNIFACNGVLFNHESYLRGSNFFVKKAVKGAVEIKKGIKNSLTVGDLRVKRDFGYAPEYVKAMYRMLQSSRPSDYVICSGKSLSLREILYYIFDQLELDKDLIKEDTSLLRPNEIPDIYGDNTKAKNELQWDYSMDFYQVLDLLIEEEIKNYRLVASG